MMAFEFDWEENAMDTPEPFRTCERETAFGIRDDTGKFPGGKQGVCYHKQIGWIFDTIGRLGDLELQNLESVLVACLPVCLPACLSVFASCFWLVTSSLSGPQRGSGSGGLQPMHGTQGVVVSKVAGPLCSLSRSCSCFPCYICIGQDLALV